MDWTLRHQPLRRWSWPLLAGLTLVNGCAEVQNRQWGYPNLLGRRTEVNKAAKPSAPKVMLRVDPESLPGSSPTEER